MLCPPGLPTTPTGIKVTLSEEELATELHRRTQKFSGIL